MSRFDAVIFDMDGVIVDSEPIHKMSFLELWQEMGYGDNHGIHFPDFYGQSDRAVWLAFIKKHHPAQSIGDLTRLKEDRLIQLLRDKQPIFDGVPNLVRQLAKRLPLAVASGSVHRIIDEVLAMRDLRCYFRCIASSEDVEKPKPAPDTFLLAARRLGVMPNKVLCDRRYRFRGSGRQGGWNDGFGHHKYVQGKSTRASRRGSGISNL